MASAATRPASKLAVMPGKAIASSRSAIASSFVTISPPAGPPSDLSVRIVIRCAPWSSGLGQVRPAIMPHWWAASNITCAPTRSAMARTAATSVMNPVAEAALSANQFSEMLGSGNLRLQRRLPTSPA
jgi:hypothetical protein